MKFNIFLFWFSISVLIFSSPLYASKGLIWIEGEDAGSSTMREHGWYNSVKKAELSKGAWLSHFSSSEMPVAHYDFLCEEEGVHEFWLRANPIAGAKISVRINGQNWQNVSLDKLEQQQNIASDGKPDMRFIAWIKGQPITLRQGENSIDLRFESGNNYHGGIDCFVLSREPFLPQGNRKPGEKTGLADEGAWAFEPDRDSFSSEALLDLSLLNEKPAGKHGRIRRSANGSDFVDGLGEPIRFWAVNTTVHYNNDITKVEEHARWLAKRGVNMVRHHGHLAPGNGSLITDVNQSDIEAAWKLASAMKKQGIYVTLSPYWAVSVKPQPDWALKDAGGSNLTGLLFFDPDLQAAYKTWLRKLLVSPNPYTGIPLAMDPVLAIFQIQNEDSLLFWTESSIKSEQRRALGDLFGKWLIEHDGTLEKTVKRWGGDTNAPEDDFARNRVMPFPVWNLTQSSTGPMEKRLNDQLQFYTELMYDFNTEIARFLKEDIGYEGLVNAGNWRTADQGKLLDAERFAYSANDVIAVNRYYNGGSHTNPNDKHRAGYLVSQGDLFTSESALKQPAAFPLTLRQVRGHPMIISESSWVPPLLQQSEGPFLVAAYSALTGFDIFYWFSTSDIGFGLPMGKWQVSSPAQLGMFPAAAFMFRKGYIQQGKPTLVEYRTPENLWTRQIPLLPEQAGFDPNRDMQIETGSQGTLTPLAFLTGGVEVAFRQGVTKLEDLESLIDEENSTVQSVTGELLWNYDKGICFLDTPKAKGITGNLAAAGRSTFGSLTVNGHNEYASLLLVSLDDVELDQSKRILLQICTTARPYGWKTEPAGEQTKRIVNLGSSPWNIENVDIDIQLTNSKLRKVTALDANGMSNGEVPIRRSEHGIEFSLPQDAIYILIE